MPPIKVPITQASCVTPRDRTAMAAESAISSMLTLGNVRLYRLPVLGLIEAGPVEQKQPPSGATQMTYQSSVSITRRRPMKSSHQPFFGSTKCEAACALADISPRMSAALSRAAFSRPQVSYPTLAPHRRPPPKVLKPSSRSVNRVPGGMSSKAESGLLPDCVTMVQRSSTSSGVASIEASQSSSDPSL